MDESNLPSRRRRWVEFAIAATVLVASLATAVLVDHPGLRGISIIAAGLAFGMCLIIGLTLSRLSSSE